MYSLNINFLKDRPELNPNKTAKAKGSAGVSLTGQAPLFLGAGVGVVCVGIVGGFFLYLIAQIGSLEARRAELDDQLADLQAEIEKAEEAQFETGVIENQTQALIGVFNRVRSWSAILTDIRDRMPAGLQVEVLREETPKDTKSASSSKKSDEEAAAAAPPAPSRPPITITGYANSIERVGEFLVLLQKSPFLDPEATRLVSTTYEDNPASIETPDPEDGDDLAQLPEGFSYTIVNAAEMEQMNAEVSDSDLPQIVSYEITTAYTPNTAMELKQELERRGAIGLVTRLTEIEGIQGASPDAAAAEDAPENEATDDAAAPE
jgi:type IV pilus assembly protein PilN